MAPGQLLARILRERFSGFFLDQLFVVADDGFQVVGGEVGVELDLGFLLALVENVVELLHVDVERDFAEHLDEAAVAIVGEARISAFAPTSPSTLWSFMPRLRMVFIMPGMENFAPERTLRSSGSVASPSFLPICSSSFARAGCDLLLDFVGDGVLVLEINIADFGGDGEAGRHGHARRGSSRRGRSLCRRERLSFCHRRRLDRRRMRKRIFSWELTFLSRSRRNQRFSRNSGEHVVQ